MRMVFVIALLLFVAFSLESFAQAPPPPKPVEPASPAPASPCPRLEMQTQNSQNVRDGQPVTFVASISGGDPNVTPTLVWNVSAGSIRDGQGTRRIEVDSTGAGVDRQIVADVWIGGYAPECASQGTARVKVTGNANKIDEFGDLEPEKENERIAGLASALPTGDTIYLIAYAGRANVRGYASNSLKRIRTQFAANGIGQQRIGGVDGGFREEVAYEIWIVPEGAEPPRPTPTVDRKDIVFPAPVRTMPAKAPAKKP